MYTILIYHWKCFLKLLFFLLPPGHFELSRIKNCISPENVNANLIDSIREGENDLLQEIWQFFWLVFMSDEPCKCYKWLCTVMFAKQPQASWNSAAVINAILLSSRELSVITGKMVTVSHRGPYRFRTNACRVFLLEY